jgi:hypothetical protein
VRRGDVADFARACGDVVEGTPAAGEQDAPASAQAAERTLDGVAGAGIDIQGSCWITRYPRGGRFAITLGKHDDLGVQLPDQLPQRAHLVRVWLGQEQAIQSRAEQVRAGNRDAELGQDRAHPILATGPQLDQLLVPGDLAKLADLGLGDPQLG